MSQSNRNNKKPKKLSKSARDARGARGKSPARTVTKKKDGAFVTGTARPAPKAEASQSIEPKTSVISPVTSVTRDSSLITIAIVGRPNVGKSTLFNRLIGRKKALVHDTSGVTRDRNEEKVIWWIGAKAYPVKIIDTGGLGGDTFTHEIRSQVEVALSEAQIVLVVVDSDQGVQPLDREVIGQLRRSGILDRQDIRVLGLANKVDHTVHDDRPNAFYELGFVNEWYGISAEHNRGIEDLKDMLRENLRAEEVPEVAVFNEYGDLDEEAIAAQELKEREEAMPDPNKPVRIAIIGKPNVGKSTLVNALLKDNRMITSSIAGTTVDSVDSAVMVDGRQWILVDTAGIRRKSKTEKGIEVLSIVQTKKALDRCDIAFLVVDGSDGVVDQDEKIAGLIEDVGCSVIIMVNKWDTQARNPDFSEQEAADIIRKQMAFIRYAPILFISALKHKGFEPINSMVEEVLSQRKSRLPTHELTEWIRKESEIHNPKNAKFYMSHQVSKHPPTFMCHVSDPKKINFSLKRHLINSIRTKWGFMGTPLRISFVKGGSWANSQRRGTRIKQLRGGKEKHQMKIK